MHEVDAFDEENFPASQGVHATNPNPVGEYIPDSHQAAILERERERVCVCVCVCGVCDVCVCVFVQ